jgi:drug/metabolite transporter (DMT)-like permease
LSGQKGGFCVPITATYPLVTALFAVLFLGEPLSPSRVLGALLIVAGVYFVR